MREIMLFFAVCIQIETTRFFMTKVIAATVANVCSIDLHNLHIDCAGNLVSTKPFGAFPFLFFLVRVQ